MAPAGSKDESVDCCINELTVKVMARELPPPEAEGLGKCSAEWKFLGCSEEQVACAACRVVD